jgi:hypothetical protein
MRVSVPELRSRRSYVVVRVMWPSVDFVSFGLKIPLRWAHSLPIIGLLGTEVAKAEHAVPHDSVN